MHVFWFENAGLRDTYRCPALIVISFPAMSGTDNRHEA